MALNTVRLIKTCAGCKEKTEHKFITDPNGYWGLSCDPVFMGTRVFRCQKCGHSYNYTNPPYRVVDLDKTHMRHDYGSVSFYDV